MTNSQQAPATTLTVIIYQHPTGETGRTLIRHAVDLDRREQAVAWSLGQDVTVTHALSVESFGRPS